LDYTKEKPTIDISMTRLRPPTSSNNTLFVLVGGPGQSGWNLVNIIPQMVPPALGITIVLPDHRGTGLSTPLACDDKGSQTISADCVAYLTRKYGVSGLNQFSITSAARDLSVQIQSFRLKSPGRLVVTAASYGTKLLDRFLTIYPKLVDAAVMDGVVNPQLSSFSRAELWASVVGEQLLTYCQVDTKCKQYFPFGQSPQNVLRKILKEIDEDRQVCIKRYFSDYEITSVMLRELFFNMIAPAQAYWDRTVIPAVIFRLNRCNRRDAKALSFFFNTSFGQTAAAAAANTPFLQNMVLNYNIAQSEQWVGLNETEVDPQTVADWHSSTIIAPNTNAKYIALRDLWPRYALDQYSSRVASYSPLMMITGLLDPSTLFHEAAQVASITARTRTFHPIPLSGHVTLNLIQAGFDCPLKLIFSWAFPAIFGAGDPSCTQKMPTTIDFVGVTAGGQKASMNFLNVTQPFEN
jgi:pimeloyl-ACP methyl ester carboxylesterase